MLLVVAELLVNSHSRVAISVPKLDHVRSRSHGGMGNRQENYIPDAETVADPCC